MEGHALHSRSFWVLNLIITGMPSILLISGAAPVGWIVLNLIITGMPSIQKFLISLKLIFYSFKPYYNWNAFNTLRLTRRLNWTTCFKPYYNWNAFNTAKGIDCTGLSLEGFKPYYNWNAFNTLYSSELGSLSVASFKPYYNWNAFNTNPATWLFHCALKF